MSAWLGIDKKTSLSASTSPPQWLTIETVTMNEQMDSELIERHEMRSFTHSDSKSSFPTCKPSSGIILIFVAFLFLLSLTLFLVGSVFCVLFINYENYHASVWAFLTGSVAIGNMSLYVLYFTSKMDFWHDRKTLEGLKFFGMIICFISLIAVCTYFILGFLKKQDFDFYGTNFFSSAAFSGLSLASSLFLYFSAQWYQNSMKIPIPAISMPKAMRTSLVPDSAVVN